MKDWIEFFIAFVSTIMGCFAIFCWFSWIVFGKQIVFVYDPFAFWMTYLVMLWLMFITLVATHRFD